MGQFNVPGWHETQKMQVYTQSNLSHEVHINQMKLIFTFKISLAEDSQVTLPHACSRSDGFTKVY